MVAQEMEVRVMQVEHRVCVVGKCVLVGIVVVEMDAAVVVVVAMVMIQMKVVVTYCF